LLRCFRRNAMEMQYRGNTNINIEKNKKGAQGLYRGIKHSGLKSKLVDNRNYKKLYRGQIQ